MARIFVAIRFNDEVKKTLVDIQNTLKAKGVMGNYCPYGNSLVRQPTNIITDIDIPQTSISVDRIVVMKSERIDGKLIYWSEGI